MPSPLLRLARYRELAADVAERLSAHPDEEVLVASGGVAAAIAMEIVARSASGVASPRLRTVETLAQQILNDRGEYPRVAGGDERRLAMRTAVRAVDDPMMESRGIAAMLERSYRDMRDNGMALQQFEARVRATRGLRDAARSKTIVVAWREYERVIAQFGAIDPADLLERAAKAIAAGSPIAPQIVAGFYDMTGMQFRFVDAIAKVNKLTAVHAPIGEGENYAFASRFLSALSTQHSALSTPVLRIKHAVVTATRDETKQSELERVTADIAELLANGVEPRAIGIVARSFDAYDARLLNRFAAERGFTATLGEEIPLTAHRLGRGLVSLLRLRERGFIRGEVLELLRDGFEPRRRVKIDDLDVATRRARIAGGTVKELAAVQRRPFIDDYLDVVAELEEVTAPLAAQLRGTQWSDALAALVVRFRLETQQDVEAANEIDAIAAIFRRAGALRFDATAIIDLIEQHSLATPANDLPRVWAGDLLKFRGRSFEHLFVVRMQDDVFPQRRIEDPLLPDADRRLLNIREIGNGRDEEQLLFQLLFDAAATSLRFSYAGTDGFGKVLRASQLLWGRVLRQPQDGRRPHMESPSQRQLQLLAKSGTRSVFDGYISAEELAPRFRAALERISPTGLEDFGECPQKFLLKHILGVRDLDDPERELQIHHREKGILDHGILERFYRGLRDGDLDRAEASLPQLPDDLASALDAIVDEEFDRIESEAPPFNRPLRDIERRATKRNLRDFVAVDFRDLLARGLTPRHFEYTFGAKYGETANRAESFAVEAAGVSIRVDGRIDRIDASRDDRLRIIDYKSGQALRHKDLDRKIDRGVRLQLALYAMAIAEFFGADAKSVSGAIKPLIQGEIKAAKFTFELADKEARLRETLELFAGAILRGIFPAFPNETDDVNSCKYCPVSHSCRTKHDVDERYTLQQSREPRTLLEELR
ncbi:MAG: ATP-dependent helicase/nuclease subunit [Acidobacteriota bacterium]|jgi:ATP-dependent helicase/DNAse subunit B|nr:ATP-dependent helicase/nuclease subunit [Acidobacteriota bacterium]